jgi:solute carrier family 25 S-adenosylmethionine transporter 26
MFPLDTVKTRLQAGNVKGKLTFTSAYRGIESALPGSMLSSGTFFAVYEGTKNQLQSSPGASSAPEWTIHMASAASADIFACAVRNPLEVVKQQMQAGLHENTLSTVKHIWREEGMRGFFAGYMATVARDIPFDMIQFAIYEGARSYVVKSQDRPLSSTQTCGCGCTAGTVAAGITTPFDVVKTRMMTQGASAVRIESISHGLYTIGVEEGLQGLWRGVAARCLYNGMGGMVMFSMFETARQFFEEHL